MTSLKKKREKKYITQKYKININIKNNKCFFLQVINSIEEWNGNNFFLYKNKIFTGPMTFKNMIVTFTSSLVPLVLFISFNLKVNKKIIIYNQIYIAF